jgi:hypothetical protein
MKTLRVVLTLTLVVALTAFAAGFLSHNSRKELPMTVCTGHPRPIKVGLGAEDFALDADGPRGPRLLVAALRRPPSSEAGTLWSVDLTGAAKEQPRPIPMPRAVFPSGIALARRDGRTFLYFTNQPPQGTASIEMFEVASDELTWRESFSDARLSTPNDLVVTSKGDLYVTDLHLPRNAFLKAISATAGHAGKVLRFDNASRQWAVFAESLSMPNGIATDAGERFLLVNELKAKRLRIFHLATGQDAVEKPVELDGYPDNLHWEAPGILDVALHVSWLRIGRHLGKPAVKSPSRGCRVDLRTFLKDAHTPPQVTPLYELPDFSGGSSALVHQGTLYVSQVMGNEVLVIESCRPPADR